MNRTDRSSSRTLRTSLVFNSTRTSVFPDAQTNSTSSAFVAKNLNLQKGRTYVCEWSGARSKHHPGLSRLPRILYLSFCFQIGREPQVIAALQHKFRFPHAAE
jgi:hypothetical protein